MLEAGTQPEVYDFVVELPPVTSLSFDAPEAVFYLRLSAVNAIGQGPPTGEVHVVVGTGGGIYPGSPRNLTASTPGNLLSLNWTEPPPGALPITGYVLRAGTTPGSSNVATLPLGLATSFHTALLAIPAGVYYVRVSAQNAIGQGPPSDELPVSVTPAGLPGAPGNFIHAIDANTLALSWSAPASASQIAGYILRAGTAPGLSDAATLPLGPSTAFVTPLNAIPAGVYFVRVSAVNASGEGPSSAELPIMIGPPCTTPGAPVLVGSASNHVVSLAWTTPTGGPITGYRVLAGVSPGLPTWSTFVGLTHTLSAVVPDGTYVVRVVAEAACGAGTPSNEVVITTL